MLPTYAPATRLRDDRGVECQFSAIETPGSNIKSEILLDTIGFSFEVEVGRSLDCDELCMSQSDR